jgi:hypothetical protein
MPIMSMGMHPTPRKLVVYLSCDPGYRYVVGVFNLLREDFLAGCPRKSPTGGRGSHLGTTMYVQLNTLL